MTKETVERIKALVRLLDPAEIAVLTGWMLKQVRMDVPRGDECPHYDKAGKDCEYPEVVQ